MRGLTVAAVTAALLSTGPVWAAGFALKEQSALALGSAFAGATAGAEDISHAFFNPAALSRFDGIHAVAIASYISPVSTLQDSSSTNAANIPLGGDSDDRNFGKAALVPAFYGAAQINDRVRIGLSLNVPFGLETRYPRNWSGRYHGVESELTTVNLSPMVAVDVNPWLSIGGGVMVQYADAELTNAIDFGTIGAGAGGTPGQDDGFGSVTGDDVGVGFNLGLLAEPVKGTRFGVGFRSKIDHTLEGEADFTLSDNAGLNAALTAGGAFADTDATAKFESPAMVSFGIFHEVDENLAIMGEAQWTQWSSFDQLIIDFDNPNQPNSVTEQNWDDQWFLAAGARYDFSEEFGIRFGFAYDQKAVKTTFRTPRIPDSNRYWFAAGLNWQPTSNFELAAGFTYIHLNDAEVRLRTNGADDNASRGNFDAEYDSFINILTLSGTFKF